MVKDTNFTKTRIHTQASSKMGRLMAWESISGRTANFTMGNGRRATRMGMAFGGERTEIRMSGSGWGLRQRDMVFTSGRLVISMKESGKIASRKGQGQNSLRTVTSLSEPTKMGVRVEKASINGQMALLMLGIFLMALSMARANGKKENWDKSQATKENTNLTKRTVTEFFTGQVATFTKETLRMTNAMAEGS